MLSASACAARGSGEAYAINAGQAAAFGARLLCLGSLLGWMLMERLL
jgi:hypothetical protein